MIIFDFLKNKKPIKIKFLNCRQNLILLGSFKLLVLHWRQRTQNLFSIYKNNIISNSNQIFFDIIKNKIHFLLFFQFFSLKINLFT